MAEFEKAITQKPDFIAERLGKLRQIAAEKAAKFDHYFLARQHVMFMQARAECHCRNHDCGGCRVTLAIASALEADMESMDQVQCEREEAIAMGMWERRKELVRETVRVVADYFRNRKAT